MEMEKMLSEHIHVRRLLKYDEPFKLQVLSLPFRSIMILPSSTESWSESGNPLSL